MDSVELVVWIRWKNGILRTMGLCPGNFRLLLMERIQLVRDSYRLNSVGVGVVVNSAEWWRGFAGRMGFCALWGYALGIFGCSLWKESNW